MSSKDIFIPGPLIFPVPKMPDWIIFVTFDYCEFGRVFAGVKNRKVLPSPHFHGPKNSLCSVFGRLHLDFPSFFLHYVVIRKILANPQ